MSTSRYLLGAAELSVIAAALGLGAYHLRALLTPAWKGALARLAEVVIGISMLFLVSEFFGVLGLFKEVPLLLGSVAAGLLTTFLVRRRSLPEVPVAPEARSSRSEEHTSELQSLRHLVCRLLLEKKKHYTNNTT